MSNGPMTNRTSQLRKSYPLSTNYWSLAVHETLKKKRKKIKTVHTQHIKGAVEFIFTVQ